jgi:glycosyltransferase involved in cell wall biosynthesis
MRILYHHRTRAADAQGVHIAEMISAFRSLGHIVEMAALVTPPPAQQQQRSSAAKPFWQRCLQSVPCLYELVQLGYNAVGFWLLVRHVLRFRPHFIYERYSLFNFSGVLAARLFRIPLLLEVNSPLADESAGEGLLRLYRFGLWSERVICNSATTVVAVTGVLKDILVRNGIQQRKILVLPNGVSPSQFAPIPPDPALRRSLALDGRRVIGFVGWFRPWHGLELLIEAFHSSRLHEEGVSLLLVGDGPAMPSLHEAVSRFQLQQAVVFTGAVPHQQIPPCMALFDCAVQPAANPYCCPMKIIEYLALGKPVIAPAQPNIEELVDDGVEAILFRPGDPASLAAALQRLFHTDGLFGRLRENAASSIQRRGYLWSRNAERVIEALFPNSCQSPPR